MWENGKRSNVGFARNCMTSIIGRMSSQRRRQRQSSGSGTGLSDRDSTSHSGQRRRSGAATVAWSPPGRSMSGSSRWAADFKGEPGSEAGAIARSPSVPITGARAGLNDPEVTMSNVLANTNLIAHEKALTAAGDAIALVLRVPAPLKSIADQVIRSANSVPANLAEGHGRTGRDRVHFWRIAYASAKEVDSHLRLLGRAGVINTRQSRERARDPRSGPRHDLAAHQPEDLNDHDAAPGLVRPLSPKTAGGAVIAPVAVLLITNSVSFRLIEFRVSQTLKRRTLIVLLEQLLDDAVVAEGGADHHLLVGARRSSSANQSLTMRIRSGRNSSISSSAESGRFTNTKRPSSSTS